MSAFGGILFTNKGRNLQAKAQTGVQLKFTKISLGEGELGTSTIPDLTGLKKKVLDLPIERLRVLSGGRAEVGSVLSNQKLSSGFYYRELGLFAEDPQEGEILYCYGNAGALAEYIPASGGPDVVEKQIVIQTIVGNATNITAVIDSSLVYATVVDMNRSMEQNLTQSMEYTDLLIASLEGQMGQLSNLSTTEKTNLVAAINELKVLIAAADKKFETPSGAQAKVDAHGNRKDNPHSVTATQVGAYTKGEADNKFETPTGSQAKVDTHANRKDNPHGVTATQVGAYTKAESDNKYETPSGSQAKVDIHANKKDNPHGVTATQVGAYTKAEADGKFETPSGAQSKVDNGTAWKARYFEPTQIVENSDLNAITTPGPYFCSLNSIASTIKNSPTTTAFSLFVEKHAGTKQTLTEYHASGWKQWQRNVYNGVWGQWVEITTNAQRILPDDARTSEDVVTSYPEGASVMRVTKTTSGFPNQFGVLTTFRSGGYAFQHFVTVTGNRLSTRIWNPNTNVWDAWSDIQKTLQPTDTLTLKNLMNKEGYSSSNTDVTGNRYTKLFALRVDRQYGYVNADVDLIIGHNSNKESRYASIHVRLKQQNAMGGAPEASLYVKEATGEFLSRNMLRGIITTNNASETVLEVWTYINTSYEEIRYFPENVMTSGGNSSFTPYEKQNFTTLPAGTIINAHMPYEQIEYDSTGFQVVKSGKDAYGNFTTVEYKRKRDGSTAIKSVLSGGTAPQYTTRTLTYYDAFGTYIGVKTFTLSYDEDGDLISEV